MTDGAELARARVLTNAGRYADTIPILSRVIAGSGENAEAWRLLAQCHLGLADLDQAETAARRSLALAPQSEWGHRLLAVALSRSRRHDPARTAVEEAVRLGPNSWRAHQLRVDVDIAAGWIAPDTWQAAERAIELAPQEPSTHLTLGRLALATKQHRKAARAFQEALRLDPGNAMARNNLAVVRLRQRRLPSAGTHLAGALRLEPTSAMFAKNLRIVFRIWASALNAVGVVVAVVLLVLTSGHEVGTASTLVAPSLVFGPSLPDHFVIGSRTVTLPPDLPSFGVPATMDHVADQGRPAALVIGAAVLVLALLAVLAVVRRGIGPAAGRVVASSLRRDGRLALSAASAVIGVAGIVIAAAVGLPAARSVLGVAIFVDVVLALMLRAGGRSARG